MKASQITKLIIWLCSFTKCTAAITVSIYGGGATITSSGVMFTSEDPLPYSPLSLFALEQTKVIRAETGSLPYFGSASGTYFHSAGNYTIDNRSNAIALGFRAYTADSGESQRWKYWQSINSFSFGDQNFVYMDYDGDQIYEAVGQFYIREGGAALQLQAIVRNDDGSSISIDTAKTAIAATVPEPNAILFSVISAFALIYRRRLHI